MLKPRRSVLRAVPVTRWKHHAKTLNDVHGLSYRHFYGDILGLPQSSG
jgi:hypothetical protein